MHAQAGVIDDSQYIAGPQQRAAIRAPRRLPEPVQNATSHVPAAAPTVASPGVPVSTPGVPEQVNITAVQQPPSVNNTSRGVGSSQAVHAKAPAKNATAAGHASLIPANRYQTAPPPPQAAKEITTEIASHREPAPARAKVAPPSANDTSPGVGSPQVVHVKAAARNATKAEHASLRPANRYQTAPSPPQSTKKAAKEKTASSKAPVPAPAKVAQEVPPAGALAQQPSRGPLQPGGLDEAGSAARQSPDRGGVGPLFKSAAPPVTEQGAVPSDSTWLMAASPKQEPVLAEAPLLADSPPFVAAEAPVPAQAPVVTGGVSQSAAWAPNSVKVPILASSTSQAATAEPDLAPAATLEPIPESVLRNTRPVADRPALSLSPAPVSAAEPALESSASKGEPEMAYASILLSPTLAPASVSAPEPPLEPAAGMGEPEVAYASVLQSPAVAPASAAAPAPESATSKGEPEVADATVLQGPAVLALVAPAPASSSAAEPAPEQATSKTLPEADSAALLQGATLTPAPVPSAESAPEPDTSKGAPDIAYASVLQSPAVAPASASAAEPAAHQTVSKTSPEADSAAFLQGATLAPAPGAQAAPEAAAVAAAPAEAPHGAAFPPTDASTAAGAPAEAPQGAAFPPMVASAPTSAVGQPRHGALQVALAQPAQIVAAPPENAPLPATGGHITQAAADSDSRAAAARQTIGVVQASVVSNRALPSMQAPAPSTASGLQVLELAEAPATASAAATAPLQEPGFGQHAASAGPAEAEPSTLNYPSPSDPQQAAIIAEAPRGADAVVPGPELGGPGESSAVQASQSKRVALRPSGERLPGDNAAFFSTTDVLQPDAASPESSTRLIKVSFKSQALTTQLFRAAPGSRESAVLQPLAAAYAPTPVGQVQPSAYGGYLRTVGINVAQSSDQAAQTTALSAPIAAPILNIGGAPGPAITGLQPQMGAYKVASAPEAIGSFSDDQASAMQAPEPARTAAYGHETYSLGDSGVAEALSPGQKALEQLLSTASPHTQPGQVQAFTSGYFDVWAAPAPCDGFFSIRARRAPLEVQPSPQPSGGAMPASRYGGGERMQPALPVRPSVPAPAPGRSLSLHPLGALAVLAPVPAPVEPATAEPNEAPNAAYHAGYYAGLQAAQAALAATGSAPAPAPGKAATSAASVALAAAHAPLGALPAPQPAKESREQSSAQAPLQGVYGSYGGYAARAPAAQGTDFAHAPVVREYPAEGMPAPVTAPMPSEGMLMHAVSPASYVSYGTGPYAYAQTGASYARSPRSSTVVRPAEAPTVQAYAPATAQASPSPYAGYGTETLNAAPAAAAAAPPNMPPPASKIAAALSPEAPAIGQPTVQPALASLPASAPVPSALLKTTHTTVGSALAPTPTTAPEAAATPAHATATSAPAYAPAPHFTAGLILNNAVALSPAQGPSPATAPVPSALLKANASVSFALAPTPTTAPEAAVAPGYATATSAPASAPAYAPAPHGHAFTAGLHENKAVAPSPVQEPQQSHTPAGAQSACGKCAAYGVDRLLSVEMSVSDGSELAQFSTSDGVPSNLVYFVADVAFSHAPLSFTTQQISAANGAIIDVYPQDKCGHYLVKGYVEQPESGDPMKTDIVLSIRDGAVFDCNGQAFPGSTLTSSILNRPTGSLHTPSLMQSASGPVSNQSQVLLTLTFSQPVSSVSPADISVKLTQTHMPGTQAVTDGWGTEQAQAGSSASTVSCGSRM
ncbi:g1796 [Coccomyxa elongata]